MTGNSKACFTGEVTSPQGLLNGLDLLGDPELAQRYKGFIGVIKPPSGQKNPDPDILVCRYCQRVFQPFHQGVLIYWDGRLMFVHDRDPILPEMADAFVISCSITSPKDKAMYRMVLAAQMDSYLQNLEELRAMKIRGLTNPGALNLKKEKARLKMYEGKVRPGLDVALSVH